METYNSTKWRLLSFILTLAGAGICLGSSTTYTGSLSVADGGLTAYGAWDCPSTTLSWIVDNTTAQGKWHYSYTLAVPVKEISHMIIEASDGENAFTESNLFSPSSSPSGWIESIAIQNFSLNNSTPYMPDDMWGIKFDSTMDATTVTRTAFSPRSMIFSISS